MWARQQFHSSAGAALGTAVAVGGVVAGILDVVENLSMLGYLNGRRDWSRWTALAGTTAVPKFLLALASVVYIVTGMLLFLVRRRSR